MARIPAEVLRIYVPGQTLAEALPRCARVLRPRSPTKSSHIGSPKSGWARQVIESGAAPASAFSRGKKQLLARLTAVTHSSASFTRPISAKAILDRRARHDRAGCSISRLSSPPAGTRKTVIGMAHRRAAQLLAHVVNVSYETILRGSRVGRREETAESEGWNAGTGDVKYHHGAEGVYHTASARTWPHLRPIPAISNR